MSASSPLSPSLSLLFSPSLINVIKMEEKGKGKTLRRNNYISLSHQQENHINLIQTVSYICEENTCEKVVMMILFCCLVL